MSDPAARWIDVAAAVLERPDGSFLLAQRPEGKVYAGWWEFPGGKVEAGEPVADALARELHEELGLEVTEAVPWITRTHVYEHGHVRLHFWRVTGWRGEPEGREGQRFAWQRFPALTAAPILPANGPILKALALPLQMAVTCAERIGEALSLDRLDAALDRGLRLVQVREKGWSEDRLLRFARAVVERARRRDARVVLNGTADQAAACGADGVHLSAAALARIDGRPDLPLVGASCHTAGELMRVADLQLDYAVLGPVAATTSHPEASPIGWSAFSRLVSGQPMPVFAIGGLDPVDLPAARRAGAHGVAMIRGAFPDRP